MKVDYSNSKIYKITNDYNDDIYIGSTCDSLTKRFSYHKSHSILSVNANRPLYKLINEIGFDRFRIQLIINFPCEDKYQLRQKEGEYIRQFGSLNKIVAGRTIVEGRKDHYQIHKKEILEQNKNYCEKNKEKIKITRHKYYEEHKSKILELNKQYITCDCGCQTTKQNLLNHKKTKKHIDLMKNQESN